MACKILTQKLLKSHQKWKKSASGLANISHYHIIYCDPNAEIMATLFEKRLPESVYAYVEEIYTINIKIPKPEKDGH